MMKIVIQIDGQDHSLRAGLIKIKDLYELADCGDKRLCLIRNDDTEIPMMSGEYLNIHGGEVLKTNKDLVEEISRSNDVKPLFNGARDIVIDSVKITGKQLKNLDATFPNGRLFIETQGEVDVEIEDDMTIILQDQDSFFVIPPSSGDVIDHEECGKHNRQPPKGFNYSIRIDGAKHIVKSSILSGAEILSLAEKRVDEWSLNKKWHFGKRERVKANEKIDLSLCGIERFETVPKQAQYGHANTFGFLPEDIQYLDQHFPSRWSKEIEGNAKHGLIIRDFPIPTGYKAKESTLMLLVPTGYPGSALDMFYFWRPLEKIDGTSILNLNSETHFGKEWQRWSRHYDWKSGRDSIVRHIEFVVNMLESEVLA